MSKHLTLLLGFMIGVLIFILALMIHNFDVRMDCAKKFPDPFQAYDCYIERKW